MISTQHYHTHDPIENLRIEVTLRKVRTACFDCTKMWQLLPALDFISQISSANSNADDDLNRNQAPDTHDAAPGSAWAYRFRWQEEVTNGVLVSYNTDHALPSYPRWLSATASSVTTSNAASSHLDAGKSNSRREQTKTLSALGAKNRKRLWYRTVREEGTLHRVMHIGAQIENKENILLATLSYNVNTGLLRATPGFSIPVSDTQNDPDRITQGPALSTYHFVSKHGAHYEFALDNASDLLPLDSEEHGRVMRELALREDQRCITEVEKWQNPGIPSGLFKALVPNRRSRSNEQSMVVMCEVVAVNNSVSTDPIGVEYTLDATNVENDGVMQWRVVTTDTSKPETAIHDSLLSEARSTPLCIPRRTYTEKSPVAGFGSHSTFYLKLVQDTQRSSKESMPDTNRAMNNKGSSDLPVFHFSVYSRDSWNRKHHEALGHLRLPSAPGFHDLEVSLWQPMLTIREHLDELFLGLDESKPDKYPSVMEHQSGGRSTSMWGTKCKSLSMTLRVRLNIVKSCESLSSEKSGRTFEANGSANVRVVKRSVQEILQSVRLETHLGRGLSSVVDQAMMQ